jgi:hypothetical protein
MRYQFFFFLKKREDAVENGTREINEVLPICSRELYKYDCCDCSGKKKCLARRRVRANPKTSNCKFLFLLLNYNIYGNIKEYPLK